MFLLLDKDREALSLMPVVFVPGVCVPRSVGIAHHH